MLQCYLVVNWLHFVFLSRQLQLVFLHLQLSLCCELITFCIFIPAIAATPLKRPCSVMLWIDYILYFYPGNCSPCSLPLTAVTVVNWLHFVFLSRQLQLVFLHLQLSLCCELITFCIFIPAIAADLDLATYLSVVVNWLHFVFLSRQLQPSMVPGLTPLGCELITFCIFIPAIAARQRPFPAPPQLWIDYILYFYPGNCSPWLFQRRTWFVVNWLHFVFLSRQLQL